MIEHVPEAHQHRPTWSRVCAQLLEAGETGSGIESLTLLLEMVLTIEGRWQRP